MTLLELIIASSMMTMVLVSVSVVLRTSRQAWTAHESDFVRMETAHATVRHIVRAMRQAVAVTAINTTTSGSLTIQDNNGKNWEWRLDRNTNTVLYGENNATSLLGENVVSLQFQGFEADATTATTNLDDMQCIRVTATVQLDRETNNLKSVSSWAWVRAW
jgi:type II secretory pathway component PulJ